MSLPAAFQSTADYFEECLDFFEEYRYLYNVPNIDILTEDVLNKIEVEVDQIDVFSDNIDLREIDDKFLNRFFLKLERLRFCYGDFHDSLEHDISIPVSRKKKHEILYLSNEIKSICERVACDVVVDLGSGLGYLDQQLFEIGNYKILGIDCNARYHVGAKSRQRKYHENSIGSVKYVKHTISRGSHQNVQEFLKQKLGSVDNYCMTGLHACADLSIDALDIFLKMDNAKAIAIMPCCYHKMCLENGKFRNFPLSKCLNDTLKHFKGEEDLKVPFLRLAAHPQSVDDHVKDLVFNLLSRAILQLYAKMHNYTVKRNKRKPINTKVLDHDFVKYAESAVNGGFCMIKDNNFNDEPFDVEELKTLWNEKAPMIYKKAGVYILLQNCLQPVIENFILYDRLVYLQENGVMNCKFQKILNEKISPRCLVLVAYKDGYQISIEER